MRLNGWQRLWILASTVWISAIAAIGYSTRPVGEFAPHHSTYHYQLTPASRALLLDSGSNDAAVEVEMPNGHVLRFLSTSSRTDQERVSREYHELTVKAQATARASHNRFYILLAIIPCLAVGLAGLGVAWVRRGFSGTSRAEP